MSGEKGIVMGQSDSSTRSDGINHLLVIAIDEYAHAPQLHNCVRDAEALIKVLTRKYRFNPEHVQTIYNEDATRENILETLYQYRKKIKPDDTLMIYFSGHGEVDGEDGFWVPVEAQSGRFVQYIPGDDIKRQLKKVNCFHILVIVDACFSGTIFLTPRNINPGTDAKRSRWGLASSDNRQVVLDGTPGTNSPFATSLLKHLQKNEVDIGLHHLASNVIDDMRRFKQTPVCQPLNMEGHDLGQFVFRLRGQNTFVDPRDGKVYRTVEINGKVWMAQNLDYDAGEGSSYYADDPRIGKVFGRLYSWEAAKKACPPGWHLPLVEEWGELLTYFGHPRAALIEGGESGFDAIFGGWHDESGDYTFLGDQGLYWSANKDNNNRAFGYGFIRSENLPLLCKNTPSRGLSLRCVKD